MDEQVELPNQKHQKVDRELKMSTNEDFIDHLPDSILHHILSFLSTKCAVSTCILSKRWRNLWMSTTNLKFSTYDYSHYSLNSGKKFKSFVDQVLLYHSSNITRFHLEYVGGRRNTTLTNSWISAAVKRQVQEVRLELIYTVLSLPLCLCTSKMLSVLEIRSYYYKLRLPSKVCLSSLKILRLQDLKFMDDLSVGRLFSGLPKIEELDMHNCKWENVKNVVISLPTLRRLSLVVCGDHDPEQNIVVKVTAKNLLSLTYRSDLSIDLIVDNMPSLDNANIYLYMINERSARVARYTTDLFGGLCFAKSITINEGRFQDLPYSENINLFPMFVNLTTLKFESERTMMTSASAAVLIRIFQNAPLLESLVINEVCSGEWFTKPCPRCIEFNLRDCSLMDFVGRREDMLFVESLLKVATVLKRLDIYCSVYLSFQRREVEEIINQLETLPRASADCVVNFIDYNYSE